MEKSCDKCKYNNTAECFDCDDKSNFELDTYEFKSDGLYHVTSDPRLIEDEDGWGSHWDYSSTKSVKVMDKNVFKMCYEEWIKPKGSFW